MYFTDVQSKANIQRLEISNRLLVYGVGRWPLSEFRGPNDGDVENARRNNGSIRSGCDLSEVE